MNRLFKLLIRIIAKRTSRRNIENFISHVANAAKLDLLMLAYKSNGILKYENATVSGELFVIADIIKAGLPNPAEAVFFDVGANVGDYSNVLAKEYPGAAIYAFEPNPNTFSHLVKNARGVARCFNIGMGDKQGNGIIATCSNGLFSAHASMYREVFAEFHGHTDIVTNSFKQETIDEFCESENIGRIDFLKIDTEGNELNVLKGAENSLAQGKIDMIQFEFGECNVFSRVFLRDFYAILHNYNIYRIDSMRLIPLFDYNIGNEIFRFQNFLAVKKDSGFYSRRENER
ncbi:FkbM family methyltransferase [uncultured Thiodictyon sp.]|uniref:FkbM family methyltransferase n=1 Tax=uncultured Thiodictyon sp. TaxID=1846217 RepID=UPI0025F24101|nr:FkbM family methyltransferase [uncultured Thiodictyon sp.]